LKATGPLGKAEGIDEDLLKLKLEAVINLIPYIKLVERERLRVRFATEEEYNEYFNSDELNKLFKELIADKLTTSQILLHLRKNPLSTGEISGIMGLGPSEVSNHMNGLSRQGLVSYDAGRKRFALA